MIEVQSNKLRLLSRRVKESAMRFKNQRRRGDDLNSKNELDNSHRTNISKDVLGCSHRTYNSYHTANNLDESSSTASKLTNATTEEFLSERIGRSYESSEGTASTPIRIEEDEVSGGEDKDDEAEPDEIVQFQEALVDPSCSHSEQRHVHFSTVEVREYPICMGDNPGSSRGIPLTIGWEIQDQEICNVEVYQNRPRRFQLHQLKITSLDRVLMLKRAGYSGREIGEGTLLVDKFRAQRHWTRITLRFSGFQEFWERRWRSIRNGTVYKSRKRRERDLLRPYKTKSNIEIPVVPASNAPIGPNFEGEVYRVHWT
ncbi:unnamed protein product [Cylindrotheca closterium]|uniref:Uncharacterized protein n=1 Tax=Cylindrotheca closterium TaxID=2856 RepID=A0AAD2FTG8_9STRA|nr:unnamed protein product [Cylindrotheca closterium]